MKRHEAFDRAVSNLGVRRFFRKDGQAIEVVCLVRVADWRPVQASWWRGKEACIIGADARGNFFLRHCDGSVRYWQHDTASDAVVARSVGEFVRHISE